MSSIREVNTAAHAGVRSLHAVRTICRDLIPLGGMLTDEQRAAWAKLIQGVLLTQKLTQMLRDRAEALSGTLARPRERREQIAQRA